MSNTTTTSKYPNHDIPAQKIGSCPYCASRNQCFICSKGVSSEKKIDDTSEIAPLKSSQEDVTSRKWCPGTSYPRQLIIRGQHKKSPTLSSSPSQDANIAAKYSVDELDEEFSLDYPSDYSHIEKDDEVKNPAFDVYSEENDDDAAASGDVDEDEYLEMAKLLEHSDVESQHGDANPNENILDWGDGGFDYEEYEKSQKQPAESSEPTSTLDNSNTSSSHASVVTPNVTSDTEDVITSELSNRVILQNSSVPAQNERDVLMQIGNIPDSTSEELHQAPGITATGTNQEGNESNGVYHTESANYLLNESSNNANNTSGQEMETEDEYGNQQGAVTEVGTTKDSDSMAPPKDESTHLEVDNGAINGSEKVGSTESTTASSSPSQTSTSVVSPTHSGEVQNAADDITSEGEDVNADELSNEDSLDNLSESSQHELDGSMQSNNVADSTIEEMVRAVDLAKSANELNTTAAAAIHEYQSEESIEPTVMPDKEKEAGCTTQEGSFTDEKPENDTIKKRKAAEVGVMEQIDPNDIHKHDVTTLEEENRADTTESEKISSIALQGNEELRNSNPTPGDKNKDILLGNEHKQLRHFDVESNANNDSSIGERRFENENLNITPVNTIEKQNEAREESTEAHQNESVVVDAEEEAQVNSDKPTNLASVEIICKETEGASDNHHLTGTKGLRIKGSLVMDYEVAQPTNKRRKSMGLINKLKQTKSDTIDLTADTTNGEHKIFQRKKNTRYNLRCQDGLGSSIKNIADTIDKNPSKKRKLNKINTADSESEYSRFSRTDDNESISPVCSDDDEEQDSKWRTKNEPELFEGDNDEYCFICEDGGDLLCCDYCCKSFHMHCHVPPLDKVPKSEKWMCCECKAPLMTRASKCGTCYACLRPSCGQCKFCVDNPRFGGQGIAKQVCIKKRCQHKRYASPAKATPAQIREILGKAWSSKET
eukprot:scaffold51732_cov67-Cyclotella_meneghiniana.AAC.1